jgi:hypothetical protein
MGGILKYSPAIFTELDNSVPLIKRRLETLAVVTVKGKVTTDETFYKRWQGVRKDWKNNRNLLAMW